MDPVDRATRLIRLASSPEPEEADTAAKKACALIREHDLTVVPREEYQRVLETALALRRENDALRRRIESTTTPVRRRGRIPIAERFAAQLEGVPEALGTAAGKAARTAIQEILGVKR